VVLIYFISKINNQIVSILSSGFSDEDFKHESKKYVSFHTRFLEVSPLTANCLNVFKQLRKTVRKLSFRSNARCSLTVSELETVSGRDDRLPGGMLKHE